MAGKWWGVKHPFWGPGEDSGGREFEYFGLVEGRKVEYLMDLGADVAAVDRNKDTAYDLAFREHGHRQPEHPVLLFFQSVQAPP
ncbi:unnamed protein product [Cladocopium goreaui]|uniref:Ankyrin repeat domain-containing protein 42 n=1 Tax=Cladocopium goreaui TaxID=2562237 RepID=A0A9P1GS87_9DINO|nr:unnamed protein product [Cladocopium goreaui]